MSAQIEIERLRNTNYREGKAILDEKPSAADLLRRLVADCPHIDERDLVALLRLEHEELIAATAHRLEYNATHGGQAIAPSPPKTPADATNATAEDRLAEEAALS